ncbi:MAG: thioesterase family protein [Odoribacter sp.]
MIEIGKTFIQEIIVEHKDTAVVYGSGKLEVFATPAMVGLMENTAIRCLEGMLEPDSDTVGIEINTQHTKATAVGKKVFCKATLTEVDMRRLHFVIDTWDEKGPIGHATHDRFIINPEKFMSKL